MRNETKHHCIISTVGGLRKKCEDEREHEGERKGKEPRKVSKLTCPERILLPTSIALLLSRSRRLQPLFES